MGTFFENKVQHQHMSQWKVHPITLEHFQMDLSQQQVFLATAGVGLSF
jgi:hypothetical protein